MDEKDYFIEKKDGVLTFKTRSFSVEKGSVLHTGIYNRELASTLAAAALTLAVTLVFVLAGFNVKWIFILPASMMFAGFFLFFRLAVFFEESLEAVIDKKADGININIKKFFGSSASYRLSALKGIERGALVLTPENPDGIRVVEKVALQHGTAVPGMGETKTLHTVGLEFKDGVKVTLFSTGEQGEAEGLEAELKSFIHAKKNRP